jgi:hypothetical protein
MAGMHHALILASRVVAGIVGALAFYFAFFLYEDEEGIWRNRIENLWVSVYDRAKVTDSNTTALFNQIGQTVIRWSNHLFGKKMFSLRAVVGSVNLSLAGFFALTTLLDPIMVSQYPGPVYPAMYIVPEIMGVLLCALLVTLALLPSRSSRPSALFASAIPLIGLSALAVSLFFITAVPHTALLEQPLILFLSVLADYLAIIVLRKLFFAISQTISIYRIVLTMAGILLFSLSITLLPAIAASIIARKYPAGFYNSEILLKELMVLNITTAFLCLIPEVMLIVVLMHKIIWPLLSRLLYPVASRKVITNRKLLVSVGSLCVLYVLNMPVGIKELLKLPS